MSLYPDRRAASIHLKWTSGKCSVRTYYGEFIHKLDFYWDLTVLGKYHDLPPSHWSKIVRLLWPPHPTPLSEGPSHTPNHQQFTTLFHPLLNSPSLPVTHPSISLGPDPWCWTMQPPRHGGDSWRLTEGEEGVCVIQILPTTPVPSHIQHHQPSTPLSIRPYQQSGHQNPFTPPTNTPRGSNGAVGYRGDLSEVMNKSRPMSQEHIYTNQHRTQTQGDRYRCFDNPQN